MHDFISLTKYILVFALAASVGSFLVWKAKQLFLFVKPELLRRNIITFLIGLCFFFAIGHLIPDFRTIMENYGWGKGILLCCVIVLLDVLIPYNIVLYITEGRRFAHTDFMKQQLLIFFSITGSSIITNGIMNYLMNDTTKYLKYSVVWSFYMAGFGSLIYLFTRYYDLEKKKKLYAKELEVARLNEAKTKAELDALHSKINPHFLYNALNSIADLSVTDGRKARSMTLSLADLFRYSINYSGSNYSTVKEELEIAKLYLEIEKTRFEDQLGYIIDADEKTLFYRVPRFILQPIIENAVKHGLKATGKLTEIIIRIKLERDTLLIHVYDNGPAFPEEWSPGYGLKNVYDKLELLFPNRFELKMHNQPEKNFEIRLNNPEKNEPA